MRLRIALVQGPGLSGIGTLTHHHPLFVIDSLY